MPKPRLIILVRHAQSEGNKNRDIHQTIPDHRVKITPDGWSQAHEAGRRLRSLLRPDDTLHFFTSPYRRTRETTEGILETLTSDDPGPSPFRRAAIKVYEEPRLREQDFGNFQPCSAEMERMWQERADYGHFFYRIPNGESAADAYDRVSGFNESLWRQFGDDDFASVCVLVTHGLMSRVFLMKWYHFSVEYFEDLRNINHCEFLIMRRQDHGKYQLQTKLRTWSELHRERAKDRQKSEKDVAKLERAKLPSSTRQWGGCPNGCNHTNHYRKREDLEALRQTDEEHSRHASERKNPLTQLRSPDGVQQEASGGTPAIDVSNSNGTHNGTSSDAKEFKVPAEHARRSVKPVHMLLGRDFGGTHSGNPSIAGSDSDVSEDEGHRRNRSLASVSERRITNGSELGKATGRAADGEAASTASRDRGVRVGGFANRLGDAPPSVDGDSTDEEDDEVQDDEIHDDDAQDDDVQDDDVQDEDLREAEALDRSIQGSVY